MKKLILLLTFLLIPFVIISAQKFDEKSHIINGNQEYNEGQYLKAEAQYKIALSKNSNSIKGNYNLGNALYHQDKFDEARAHYDRVIQSVQSTELDKAKAYHNIGKSYFDQNEFEKAANYFKESLKLNPTDDDTRYNYALAKKRLEQQEKEENETSDNSESNEGDSEQDEPSEGNEQSPSGKSGEGDESEESDTQQGNQSGGQNGMHDGFGNRPEEQQITKGSKGEGSNPGESLNEKRQEALLNALKQQEQRSFERIISSKTQKNKVRTEKDW